MGTETMRGNTKIAYFLKTESLLDTRHPLRKINSVKVAVFQFDGRKGCLTIKIYWLPLALDAPFIPGPCHSGVTFGY